MIHFDNIKYFATQTGQTEMFCTFWYCFSFVCVIMGKKVRKSEADHLIQLRDIRRSENDPGSCLFSLLFSLYSVKLQP